MARIRTKLKVIEFKDDKGRVVDSFKVAGFPDDEVIDIRDLRLLHPKRVPSDNRTYEFMRSMLHSDHIDEILDKSDSVSIAAVGITTIGG